MTKNKEKKAKRLLPRILLGCLGIFLLVSALIIASACYVLASIFDYKPASIVTRIPDPQALESAIKKLEATINPGNKDSGIDLDSLGLGNVNLEELDPDNLDIGKLVQNIDFDKALKTLSTPGALTGTLALTGDEVNALIDAAFTADNVAELQDESRDVRLYDAKFADGHFSAKLSLRSKVPTPFGRYCNVEVEFIPQIINHHIKLDLLKGVVGAYEIPVSMLKDTLDGELEVLEKTEDGKQILAVARSLKVDKNKVELKYDLQQLSTILLDKLPELQNLLISQ